MTAPQQDIQQQETEMSASLFKAYQEWRKQRGVGVPAMDKELSKIAYMSAVRCAQVGKPTHRTSIPKDDWSRYSDLLQYATWKIDPHEAVQSWATSTGHRAQLQCATSTKAGAAAYQDENGTWWLAIIYDFNGRNQTSDETLENIVKQKVSQADQHKYSPTKMF